MCNFFIRVFQHLRSAFVACNQKFHAVRVGGHKFSVALPIVRWLPLRNRINHFAHTKTEQIRKKCNCIQGGNSG